MALNKVDLCGVDTSKLPVLTNAQMKTLFERIAAGDETAREEFIGGNLRLVLSVVQRFAGRGEMMDDLFQRMSVTLGREPTVAEIAKELDVKQEDVVMALDAIQEPMSLNEPIYHDNGDALYVMDQIRDNSGGEEEWARSIALKGALEHLNERERMIVKMRFFGGRTQMEVAEEIGISQAQVSRLEKTALQHMKKYI